MSASNEASLGPREAVYRLQQTLQRRMHLEVSRKRAGPGDPAPANVDHLDNLHNTTLASQEIARVITIGSCDDNSHTFNVINTLRLLVHAATSVNRAPGNHIASEVADRRLYSCSQTVEVTNKLELHKTCMTIFACLTYEAQTTFHAVNLPRSCAQYERNKLLWYLFVSDPALYSSALIGAITAYVTVVPRDRQFIEAFIKHWEKAAARDMNAVRRHIMENGAEYAHDTSAAVITPVILKWKQEQDLFRLTYTLAVCSTFVSFARRLQNTSEEFKEAVYSHVTYHALTSLVTARVAHAAVNGTAGAFLLSDVPLAAVPHRTLNAAHKDLVNLCKLARDQHTGSACAYNLFGEAQEAVEKAIEAFGCIVPTQESIHPVEFSALATTCSCFILTDTYPGVAGLYTGGNCIYKNTRTAMNLLELFKSAKPSLPARGWDRQRFSSEKKGLRTQPTCHTTEVSDVSRLLASDEKTIRLRPADVFSRIEVKKGWEQTLDAARVNDTTFASRLRNLAENGEELVYAIVRALIDQACHVKKNGDAAKSKSTVSVCMHAAFPLHTSL